MTCDHDWFILYFKFTNPAGVMLKCLDCGAEYLLEPVALYNYQEPSREDVREEDIRKDSEFIQ